MGLAEHHRAKINKPQLDTGEHHQSLCFPGTWLTMEPGKIYMGLLSPVLCNAKAAVLIIELRCSRKDFINIHAAPSFS